MKSQRSISSDAHECQPPLIYGITQRCAEGDIWTCECGTRWIVKAPEGVLGKDHSGTLYWTRRILPWGKDTRWGKPAERGWPDIPWN